MDNTSLLSKYRGELMGIAAIGIILTHSSALVEWPSVIKTLCSYGGTGVYIFMFLSGIGLYYSLLKWDGISFFDDMIHSFYLKRVKRVLVPYAIIAGIWYGIQYLIIEHSILGFLYEWSTLSFWCEHKGAWYVALLIPLYLVYPLLDMWLKKGRRVVKGSVIIAIITIVQIFLLKQASELFEHLSQVLQSLWVFVLGNSLAESVEKKNSNCIELVIPFLILVLLDKFTSISTIVPTGPMIYAFEGILLTLIFAFILHVVDKTKLSVINRALKGIGSVSLESYLSNIFLIQAVFYLKLDSVLLNRFRDWGMIVLYGLIVIGGILVSLSAALIRREFSGKGLPCH